MSRGVLRWSVHTRSRNNIPYHRTLSVLCTNKISLLINIILRLCFRCQDIALLIHMLTRSAALHTQNNIAIYAAACLAAEYFSHRRGSRHGKQHWPRIRRSVQDIYLSLGDIYLCRTRAMRTYQYNSCDKRWLVWAWWDWMSLCSLTYKTLD